MYPKLVRIAATPAHITLRSAEPSGYNERETLLDGDFLCNFQAGGGVAFDAQKQRIQLSGVLLLDGDICPEHHAPADGSAIVGGTLYSIVNVRKCRNPDGTVNYTRLEVV